MSGHKIHLFQKKEMGMVKLLVLLFLVTGSMSHLLRRTLLEDSKDGKKSSGFCGVLILVEEDCLNRANELGILILRIWRYFFHGHQAAWLLLQSDK